MDDSVIQTKGLTRCFGSRAVVCDLDLDVPRGCIFGFLGRNGSGKTTTIRMLLGLLAPTRGVSRVLGEDSRVLSETTRSRIGYMAEGHPVYDGIAGNQRRRRLGQAAQLDCGPALEDARAENGRRIERLAGQCVEDKKPGRDRCGADHSAKEAFTGDRQHRRLGNHRGGRGGGAHDPSW